MKLTVQLGSQLTRKFVIISASQIFSTVLYRESSQSDSQTHIQLVKQPVNIQQIYQLTIQSTSQTNQPHQVAQ